jgi:hypothetical protein
MDLSWFTDFLSWWTTARVGAAEGAAASIAAIMAATSGVRMLGQNVGQQGSQPPQWSPRSCVTIRKAMPRSSLLFGTAAPQSPAIFATTASTNIRALSRPLGT